METRTKERVMISGISESIRYELKGDSPFIHRRIFFSSHEQMVALRSTMNGGPARHLAAANEDSAIMLIKSVFAGDGALDLSDQYIAHVDKKRCHVHSDVVLPINASGEGHIKIIRRWTPIKKEVTYADGGFPGSSSWVSATSGIGNLYCLDILANRASENDDEDSKEDSVEVSSELTYYWGE